jgi:hypothetical protein
MPSACPDTLLSALESSASWLRESRAAGVAAQDAAKAMRVQRRNLASAAESLFSTILPPAPAEAAPMPSVAPSEVSDTEPPPPAHDTIRDRDFACEQAVTVPPVADRGERRWACACGDTLTTYDDGMGRVHDVQCGCGRRMREVSR